MKFYKRFPGDITIKTGDLTLVEFGAYDRLLDHYYAKEQPIDPKRVYSVCRALNKSDRDAVDGVLAEFWTLTEAGWVQQRADEMIAEALPRIQAARENGKKGGRPSKQKPTGFPEKTESPTKSADSEKTSQSQTSPPTVKKGTRKLVSLPECPPDVDSQVWADWLSLRTGKKAAVTSTVIGAARSEAGKAGMAFEAFLRVWCLRGTQGLQADWLKPHERSQGPPAETTYARQMRERAEVLGPGVAAKAPGQQTHLTVIDNDGPEKLTA